MLAPACGGGGTDHRSPLGRSTSTCGARGSAPDRKAKTIISYSDGFRHFVLGLRAAHESFDIDAFSTAVNVPLGTMKDWLRDPAREPDESTTPEPAAPRPPAESAQIQSVLDAWKRWEGTFGGFCSHVRDDLHVPFARVLISRILVVHGARRPARREGRSSDEREPFAR